MPLLDVLITVILVGVGMWLVNAYIPMAGAIKTILNLIVVAVLCIWLLQVFGLMDDLRSIRIRD